jgi:zinc protease
MGGGAPSAGVQPVLPRPAEQETSPNCRQTEEKFLVKEDIKKVRLDSGLTVIIKENRSSPVVALQAWVKTGSADEDDQTSGVAHLHEHMLFKGTKKRAVGEIAKDVEASGGEINAWTSFDETVYHIVMASRYFEKGLDIISDAIINSSFDQRELAREKEVVLEEIRQNRDIPARKVMDELFSHTFLKHPYRRPIIGTEETVKGLSREKILEFYKRWYTPANTFVVVVGDVDAEKALEAVKKAFAEYKGTSPARSRAAEPEHREPAAVLVREKVVEVQFAAGWHTPPFDHPDTPVLDLISVITGQGESSWLRREVRRDRGMVNDVQTFSYTPADPGLFVLGAGIPAAKLRAALEDMYGVFFRVAFERVTESELEKAKAMLLSDDVFQKETVQGFGRKLGYLELVTGDLSYEEKYVSMITAVTPEDVMRVAAKYFTVEGMTVAAIIPDEKTDPMLAEFSKSDLVEPARTAMAAVKQRNARKSGTAEIFKKKLQSGIELIVQENHTLPLVAARAVFMGGSLYETEKNAGISNFTARMLTRGTGKRNADDIAREMDTMAGSISGFSGRNSIGLRAEFLSRSLEDGMGLFLDCLSDSRFPASEVDKEKPMVIEELRNREDDLGTLALDLFSKTMYRTHPYRFDPLGSEKNVTAQNSDSLRDFYRRYVVPSNLTMVVVGDVNPQQLAALIEDKTAAWGSQKFVKPRVPAEEPPTEPRSAVKYKEKEQAHIVIGFPGITMKDPDRYALEILSTVLGGQSGRLFLELRDKKSLAYAVTTFSMDGVDPGYFAVYMACAPEKLDTAVESIKEEIGKIIDGGVDEKELERAKNHLIGTHEVSLQRNSSRAAQMAFSEAYGLGYDEPFKYAEKISAVDLNAVKDAARRILKLGNSVTAVIRPQVKK